MHNNRQALAFGSVIFLFIAFVIIIVLSLWLWPKYKVYKQELNGQAALKEAEWWLAEQTSSTQYRQDSRCSS